MLFRIRVIREIRGESFRSSAQGTSLTTDGTDEGKSGKAEKRKSGKAERLKAETPDLFSRDFTGWSPGLWLAGRNGRIPDP